MTEPADRVDEALPEGHLLLVMQHAPYAGSLARAALDAAMSFAVFNQSPVVLFTADAIGTLVDTQDPSTIGRKSLRKVVDSFPLYDIDEIYIDGPSMARQGIAPSALPPGARCLDDRQLVQLRSRARQILSF